MLDIIKLKTEEGCSLVNITDQAQTIVQRGGVQEGICVVFVTHTTGAITLNSYLDPNTPKDIVNDLDRIVPTRVDFFHQNDTPTDASAHIKTTLVGNSLTLIVTGGKLLLGHSQFIMFCEFDGPRERSVHVKVTRDA